MVQLRMVMGTTWGLFILPNSPMGSSYQGRAEFLGRAGGGCWSTAVVSVVEEGMGESLFQGLAGFLTCSQLPFAGDTGI